MSTDSDPTVVLEVGPEALAVQILVAGVSQRVGYRVAPYPRPDLPHGVALAHIGVEAPVLVHWGKTFIPDEVVTGLVDAYRCRAACAIGHEPGRAWLTRQLTSEMEAA